MSGPTVTITNESGEDIPVEEIPDRTWDVAGAVVAASKQLQEQFPDLDIDITAVAKGGGDVVISVDEAKNVLRTALGFSEEQIEDVYDEEPQWEGTISGRFELNSSGRFELNSSGRPEPSSPLTPLTPWYESPWPVGGSQEMKDPYEAAKSQSEPKSNRRDILEEAIDLIDGDRNVDYGDPIQDFRRTGNYWSGHLSGVLERKAHIAGIKVSDAVMQIMGSIVDPHDVAIMMDQLKTSRLAWSPYKRDHWTDKAGYTGCGWDCVEREGDD